MIKTLSLMTDVLPHRQVHFTLPSDFPIGLAEIVVVVAPIPARNTHQLSDLLHSEFFGMWRDREDITDSALFARQLREEAWRR